MITTLDDVSEFPLCWPDTKPRCSQRSSSPFRTTMARAQEEIRWELPRWRARRWIISMAPQYRQGAVDPGVAIWWEHPVIVPGQQHYDYDLRVLACDNYLLREANMHAIALTFERLRSLERYGTYSMEQAIEGARLALPGPAVAVPSRPWFEVLGVNATTPLIVCEAAYRALAKQRADFRDQMVELNLAIEQARSVER